MYFFVLIAQRVNCIMMPKYQHGWCIIFAKSYKMRCYFRIESAFDAENTSKYTEKERETKTFGLVEPSQCIPSHLFVL